MISLMQIQIAVSTMLGSIGTVLGFVNMSRNRKSLKVSLSWNIQNLDLGEVCGLIKVLNYDTVPIFIHMVVVEFPTHNLATERLIVGQDFTLEAGSKPCYFTVRYEELARREAKSSGWKMIEVYAEDSNKNVTLASA